MKLSESFRFYFFLAYGILGVEILSLEILQVMMINLKSYNSSDAVLSSADNGRC